MCRRGPLTFADDGQSGAVNDAVQAGARAGAPKREGEMLTASRARGVIGGREIDAQPPEDRCQDARGLTQRSVEEETERQGGFDGEIGRLEVPAPPADASRCPRGDRVGREPEGDVASPHEGSVVLGPVPDAIRCRVLRMHARLHIEIMTRRRSRWSICRPLLAHRAESAHQRHSVSNLHEARTVMVGVDTHKHMHVAVAIDSRGIRLGAHSFGADSEGYRALLTWAEAYGGIEAVGMEGTGGYGVGLSRTVHRAGHRVVEVNRVDRRLRRAAGTSDTIDAEAAARAVLAGQATATPKTADGAVEMMRQLQVARDSAVTARTTAMSTLKQILVNAPPVLREPLQALTDRALVTRCAGLRPGPLDTPVASGTHTLRSLARRWLTLADEITDA